jgi:hypothetical protein
MIEMISDREIKPLKIHRWMGHSGTQFAKYQAAAGDSLGGGFNFWCSTYLIITRFLVRAQVSAIQVSNMQF